LKPTANHAMFELSGANGSLSQLEKPHMSNATDTLRAPRVLPDLAQASKEQLLALIAEMKAREASPQRLTIKRSEKGAVCVYGLGRFPVTLYASQWERLLSDAPRISAFIAANRASLATKD
jgi:hypothetical protein